VEGANREAGEGERLGQAQLALLLPCRAHLLADPAAARLLEHRWRTCLAQELLLYISFPERPAPQRIDAAQLQAALTRLLHPPPPRPPISAAAQTAFSLMTYNIW
jgi:hypothetical protein